MRDISATGGIGKYLPSVQSSFLMLIFGFFFLGAAQGLFLAYLDYRLNSKKAELRARGEPLSRKELQEWYTKNYAVPESENAEKLWDEVFEKLPSTEGILACPSIVGEKLPVEVLESYEACMKRQADIMALLQKVESRPRCFFSYLEFIHNGDFYTKFNTVEFLLHLENLIGANRGDPERCIKSLCCRFSLIRARQYIPLSEGYMKACRIYVDAMYDFMRALNLVQFSEAQLTLLENYFIQYPGVPDMKNILIAERALSLDEHESSYRQYARTYLMNKYQSRLMEYVNKFDLIDYYLSFSGVDKKAGIRYLESFEECQKIWEMPAKDRPKALEDFEARAESTIYNLATSNLAGSLNTLDASTYIDAAKRCTLTALALEKYRIKHGAMPEKLEDLVPEFMSEIPVDPFDGKPLRFVKRDFNFSVKYDKLVEGSKTKETSILFGSPIPIGKTAEPKPVITSVTSSTQDAIKKGYAVYSIGMNLIDDGGFPGADISFVIVR